MSNEVLKAMLAKLDNRNPGTAGYITNLPEVTDILNGLSPHVSALVAESLVHSDNEVSIKITIGFTIARDEL